MKENNVSEIVKVQDAIMLEIEELDDLDLAGVTGGYKILTQPAPPKETNVGCINLWC